LNAIDLEELVFYVKPDVEMVRDWDDLPPEILESITTSLGLPDIEKKVLAGLTTVFESETDIR
jgi:Fe-S cluster assembly protein SufB